MRTAGHETSAILSGGDRGGGHDVYFVDGDEKSATAGAGELPCG
ncbi:hypothetical protein [Acidiferrimicrobium sp. IK]|nr:hypothetical protein [Acidiferrimicrobium sp. IK]